MSLNSATIKLATSSTIRATVNTGGSQIQSTAPVTLSTKINRLDQLADVVESSPVDNSTLVYRSSDDKYIVRQLTLEDLGGAVDGGSF
jgi:hypothetical protein